MSGAIPLLPLYAFMAWTDNFTFTIIFFLIPDSDDDVLMSNCKVTVAYFDMIRDGSGTFCQTPVSRICPLHLLSALPVGCSRY
jgi:hypothetical protein